MNLKNEYNSDGYVMTYVMIICDCDNQLFVNIMNISIISGGEQNESENEASFDVRNSEFCDAIRVVYGNWK